jgi:pyridoxal phosphate enzyme (YggS family)
VTSPRIGGTLSRSLPCEGALKVGSCAPVDPAGPVRALPSRLESHRSSVLARVARAAAAHGRAPDALRIVAVTKSVEPALAAELAGLGSLDLGENRADGLERKVAWFEAHAPELAPRVRWHFIGHLQRNKARRVVRLASEIHSVDSPALFRALTRLAVEEDRRPGLWLQVKLADEEAKGGLDPDDLPALLDEVRQGPLPVLGLMTMAPLREDPDQARRAAARTFAAAATLARSLPGDAFVDGRARLSMGMTDDFEEAVAAGSDVLRIGSAFFEHRAAVGGDA